MIEQSRLDNIARLLGFKPDQENRSDNQYIGPEGEILYFNPHRSNTQVLVAVHHPRNLRPGFRDCVDKEPAFIHLAVAKSDQAIAADIRRRSLLPLHTLMDGCKQRIASMRAICEREHDAAKRIADVLGVPVRNETEHRYNEIPDDPTLQHPHKLTAFDDTLVCEVEEHGGGDFDKIPRGVWASLKIRQVPIELAIELSRTVRDFHNAVETQQVAA